MDNSLASTPKGKKTHKACKMIWHLLVHLLLNFIRYHFIMPWPPPPSQEMISNPTLFTMISFIIENVTCHTRELSLTFPNFDLSALYCLIGGPISALVGLSIIMRMLTLVKSLNHLLGLVNDIFNNSRGLILTKEAIDNVLESPCSTKNLTPRLCANLIAWRAPIASARWLVWLPKGKATTPMQKPTQFWITPP